MPALFAASMGNMSNQQLSDCNNFTLVCVQMLFGQTNKYFSTLLISYFLEQLSDCKRAVSYCTLAKVAGGRLSHFEVER